jgi:hypothetical protein
VGHGWRNWSGGWGFLDRNWRGHPSPFQNYAYRFYVWETQPYEEQTYSCTQERGLGIQLRLTVGRILGCRQLGRPNYPVAAERLAAGRFVAAVDLEGLPVASPPQVMAAMTASAAWSSAASAALILQFEFSETERFVLVQKTSRMFAWADILRQALYETIRSVSYIRESPGHRTPA